MSKRQFQDVLCLVPSYYDKCRNENSTKISGIQSLIVVHFYVWNPNMFSLEAEEPSLADTNC